MRRFTGKGKHMIKVGNHPHTNMIPKPNLVRRVQMQDTGNAYAMHSLYIYIYTHTFPYQNFIVTTNKNLQ